MMDLTRNERREVIHGVGRRAAGVEPVVRDEWRLGVPRRAAPFGVVVGRCRIRQAARGEPTECLPTQRTVHPRVVVSGQVDVAALPPSRNTARVDLDADLELTRPVDTNRNALEDNRRMGAAAQRQHLHLGGPVAGIEREAGSQLPAREVVPLLDEPHTGQVVRHAHLTHPKITAQRIRRVWCALDLRDRMLARQPVEYGDPVEQRHIPHPEPDHTIGEIGRQEVGARLGDWLRTDWSVIHERRRDPTGGEAMSVAMRSPVSRNPARSVAADLSLDIKAIPIAWLASRPGSKSRTGIPLGTLRSSRRKEAPIRLRMALVVMCRKTAPAMGAITHTSSTSSKGVTSTLVTE